jgi:hypothetical protein
MRVVDLAFEAGSRPIAGLIFRVEVDAAVGIGRGHDVHFEVEVFEGFIVANVEQMATVAMGDERAVFDFPGVGVFFGFLPTVESFAIEKLDEAFLGIGRENRGCDQGRKSEGKKQNRFHAAENRRDEKLAQENLHP